MLYLKWGCQLFGHKVNSIFLNNGVNTDFCWQAFAQQPLYVLLFAALDALERENGCSGADLLTVRVSTNEQNTENQKLAVLEYTNKKELTVDHWIEAKASSRKSAKARKLDQLNLLLKGDTLITAELSRLGRSVGQISMIVDELLQKKIKLICIKENIELTGKRNVQSKVMVTMFSLFAEIERDLISERTKEGLARARAEGKLLGRPKGSLGKSKLDGKQGEIQRYFQKGLNKTNIARIYGVSVPTLVNFVRTRGVPTQKAINVELWLGWKTIASRSVARSE